MIIDWSFIGSACLICFASIACLLYRQNPLSRVCNSFLVAIFIHIGLIVFANATKYQTYMVCLFETKELATFIFLDFTHTFVPDTASIWPYNSYEYKRHCQSSGQQS
jgi:hypothetical protein